MYIEVRIAEGARCVRQGSHTKLVKHSLLANSKVVRADALSGMLLDKIYTYGFIILHEFVL